MIKIIVAMDKNNLIGSTQGRMGMPWHNAEDLLHFKETTWKQTILMGRKTFEAIGRALPERKTIVVSKRNRIEDPAVEICEDLDSLLKEYADDQDIYICGGASVYQQTLDLAKELIVSYIPGEYTGNAYFPKIKEDQFMCIEEVKKETFILKKYRRIK
ncbi:dihydrofolate reductase [Beduini massiliensis]|uniref:dihydrofolate reductase n=1 Tax=Beduini massiliensis TaxID=1585974 RepID=UPI00059A8BFF|nr:dihydrofolate reductase [Beduini massiliensis]